MAEIRGFKGEFWAAGMGFERRPGVLQVGPGIAPIVEASGELTPALREVKRTQAADGSTVVHSEFADEIDTGPFMVHGVDERGANLTLLDALTIHRTFGMFRESDQPKQRVQGVQAVVGSHLTAREHPFVNFRTRLQNFDSWAAVINEPSWVREVELLGGGTLTLESPSDSGVWLRGSEIPPSSLRGIDRGFLRPLISLFTLATGTPCDLLALQVQDHSSEGQWWDVYSSAQRADEGNHKSTYQWLLKPTDLNMNHISTWLGCVEQLGPLPPGVADLAEHRTIALETQVLQLTTIAEGLHRALFPDEVRFDEDMTVRAREAAINAVAEAAPDATDTVRGLLAYLHEPSFPGRLRRLAEEVVTAVPGVTGQTNRWKELVTGMRNVFAHRHRNEFLTSEDVDRCLTTAFSLRWLLTGLLLRQAGIEKDKLGQRFSEYQEYDFFLRSARQWQPRIYGQRDQESSDSNKA